MRTCVISLFAGLVAVLATATTLAAEVDWQGFENDIQIDRWLCQNSPTYARMAETVQARKHHRGYRIVESDEIREGNVAWVDGAMEIQLHPKLAGPHRISVLVFEMGNAYRNPDHGEIDRAADEGVVRTPEEFGLAHELLEYEAFRLHREVLVELESRAGTLPAGFFFLVTPTPASAAAYRVPLLCTYLKTQQESGHTAHYYGWFHRRRAARAAAEPTAP